MLPAGHGRPVEYVQVKDFPMLLYLVNQGTLTLHPWLSRVGDLDRRDFVLFDLDPGLAKFAAAIAVAKKLNEVSEDEAVGSFMRSSGKTGLHLLMPWKEGDF